MLIAEYRELPRIRHAWPRKSYPNVPPRYKMGRGHVTFFMDKGRYLVRRHRMLVREMRNRGYNVRMPPLSLSHWPMFAMNDWQPDEESLRVNRERIRERVNKGDNHAT